MTLEKAQTFSVLRRAHFWCDVCVCVCCGTAETCIWLKGHANAIRQLLDLPGTPQPQFLASLFHILKCLCQADGKPSNPFILPRFPQYLCLIMLPSSFIFSLFFI